MTLESDRLIYKPFSADDLDLFSAVVSNEAVMHYTLWDCCQTADEAKTMFTDVLKDNRTDPQERMIYQFAVFQKATSTFVGYAEIELLLRHPAGGIGEIGYMLLPPFWGKGYASEMARAMCTCGFSEFNLHKIVASCNAGNEKSEHIMKKIGMQKEAHFRNTRYKRGQWVDELKYGILAEEFAASQL